MWASRAQEEASQEKFRLKQHDVLTKSVMCKHEKARAHQQAKKAKADAEFKARQDALKKQKDKEREERRATRAAAISKIAQDHKEWESAEAEREKRRIDAARWRVAEVGGAVLKEDEIEAALTANTEAMSKKAAKALAEQRALDEAFEKAEAERTKGEREAKAIALRAEVAKKEAAAAAAEKELAYRIKKDMAITTKRDHEMEMNRQVEAKKAGLKQRENNDKYDAWLAKDHIRSIEEQAHERRDPAKMHEGGLKGHGKPKKFT